MSDDRKAVRVSTESDKAIRTYATRRGIEFGEAADALIATGVSRLNALARYKKSKTKEGALPKGPVKKKAAAKPKAAKKAAAKKVKAEAAPKKEKAPKAPKAPKREALNGATPEPVESAEA